MDYKVLVITHGRFCEEIIKSAEMITGKNDRLIPIPLLAEDDPLSFSDKIRAEIEKIKDHPFIVICDILGGTPFNSSSGLLREYKYNIVTGLCLGMLLELAFLDTDDMTEVAEKMKEVSQNSGHIFNSESFCGEES